MTDLQHRNGAFGSTIGRTVGSYLRGQLVVMAIMTVLYTVGFYWADVPLWFLAAVICGLFHLLPIVGAILALVIPVAFALIGGGGLGQVLQIVGVFVVAQLLETFYLTPKILGRELRLSPLIVFLSVLIGGMTLGLLGALLAPLVAAVAMLAWRARRHPGGLEQEHRRGTRVRER